MTSHAWTATRHRTVAFVVYGMLKVGRHKAILTLLPQREPGPAAVLSEVQAGLVGGYLKECGYLASEEDADQLTEAIRQFQRVHRLEITGHLTPETVEAMKAPRCGLGDYALLHEFEGQPCRWDERDVLRFAFENPSRQLTPEAAFQAVR